MSRMVLCRKYQQQLLGLNHPPYPGPKGQDIYENISQKAWDEWTKLQTMLINERHLNLMDASHRKYLQEEMDKFFTGDDYERPEGYIDPEEKI